MGPVTTSRLFTGFAITLTWLFVTRGPAMSQVDWGILEGDAAVEDVTEPEPARMAPQPAPQRPAQLAPRPAVAKPRLAERPAQPAAARKAEAPIRTRKYARTGQVAPKRPELAPEYPLEDVEVSALLARAGGAESVTLAAVPLSPPEPVVQSGEPEDLPLAVEPPAAVQPPGASDLQEQALQSAPAAEIPPPEPPAVERPSPAELETTAEPLESEPAPQEEVAAVQEAPPSIELPVAVEEVPPPAVEADEETPLVIEAPAPTLEHAAAPPVAHSDAPAIEEASPPSHLAEDAADELAPLVIEDTAPSL